MAKDENRSLVFNKESLIETFEYNIKDITSEQCKNLWQI